MKKIFPVIIFLFLVNGSFGQEIGVLLRLYSLSGSLGIVKNVSIDTMIIKSEQSKINNKIAEEQIYLLRAAECYISKDYKSSVFYLKKIVIKLNNPDLDNLEYVILVGSYANLKDVENTAKFFYMANASLIVLPENMKMIKNEIRNNIKKNAFKDALANYYYYHERLKVIDEINFYN